MPKTNAEKCREYRQKRKEKKIKTNAKSSTERVREFRARRKATVNRQHNISYAHINASVIQNSESEHLFKMPWSNAEKCKNYRNRKKEANGIIKRVKKTNAEKCQMYRLRKKILAQGYQSPTNQVLYTPSTSNSPMTFGSSALSVITDSEVVNYTNKSECSQCKMNQSASTATCHSGMGDLKHNDNIICIKEEIHEIEETVPVDADIGEMLIKVEETQLVQPTYASKESDDCSEDTHYTKSQEYNAIEMLKSSYRNCITKIYICDHCNKILS